MRSTGTVAPLVAELLSNHPNERGERRSAPLGTLANYPDSPHVEFPIYDLNRQRLWKILAPTTEQHGRWIPW